MSYPWYALIEEGRALLDDDDIEPRGAAVFIVGHRWTILERFEDDISLVTYREGERWLLRRLAERERQPAPDGRRAAGVRAFHARDWQLSRLEAVTEESRSPMFRDERQSSPTGTSVPEAQTTRPVVERQPQATAARIEKLGRYMDKTVFRDRNMTCPHFAECKGSVNDDDRFYEGQSSHVGHNYDLTVDGNAVRIVVVGQEYGLWAPGGGQRVRRYVDLEERYQMIHNDSGTSAFSTRNHHMQGTTSALRLLLGDGVGADNAGEFVESADGARFHMFDAFALVNVLVCAAGPEGSSTGKSTSLMRRNCLTHFKATLKILQPTILVLQGKGVQTWLAHAIEHERPSANNDVSHAEVAGVPTVLCRFTHPSARGKWAWSSLNSHYLNHTVAPALRAVMSELSPIG